MSWIECTFKWSYLEIFTEVVRIYNIGKKAVFGGGTAQFTPKELCKFKQWKDSLAPTSRDSNVENGSLKNKTGRMHTI